MVRRMNESLEKVADALQRHKFEAQSGSESGITVLCICGHQSVSPGFRDARRKHYRHVAQAAIDALELGVEYALQVKFQNGNSIVLTDPIDQKSALKTSVGDVRDVSRLVGGWVVVDNEEQQ